MKFTLFFFNLFFLFEISALAYIDPGTGSVILQAIIGIIATIGTTAALYFNKIKNFFKRKNKKNNE